MGILVFDFGGSAVKYGFWTGNELTNKGKFQTPASWVQMKEALVGIAETVEGIEGVGISSPGVVHASEQKIKGISAIPYIHEVNIWQELEEALHVPVTIENDANCAGLAEIHEGAAKGYQEVAFVVIGTGVGGAIFHKGALQKGAHLYGGEFGLMYLDHGQTFSVLGSAVQMAWRYCERKGLAKDTFSGEEVFKKADEGDSIAQEEVEKFYDYLAQGLFNIQFSLDPEVIVLGGGVSAKPGLVTEINQRIATKMASHGLQDFVPNIVLCKYRNDANLIGAAANYEVVQMAQGL